MSCARASALKRSTKERPGNVRRLSFLSAYTLVANLQGSRPYLQRRSPRASRRGSAIPYRALVCIPECICIATSRGLSSHLCCFCTLNASGRSRATGNLHSTPFRLSFVQPVRVAARWERNFSKESRSVERPSGSIPCYQTTRRK